MIRRRRSTLACVIVAAAATLVPTGDRAEAGVGVLRYSVTDEGYSSCFDDTITSFVVLDPTQITFRGDCGPIDVRPPSGANFEAGTLALKGGAADADSGIIWFGDNVCVSGSGEALIQSPTGDLTGFFSLRFYFRCESLHRTWIGSISFGEPLGIAHRTTTPSRFSWPTRSHVVGEEGERKALIIDNPSPVPLDIDSIEVSGDWLYLHDPCSGTTLAPGGSCSAWVSRRVLVASTEILRGFVEIHDSSTRGLPRGVRLSAWSTPASDAPWFDVAPRTIGGRLLPLRGDFDGDGDDDILGWGPTRLGDDALHQTSGVARFTRRSLALEWAAGYWAITGRFDSDDKLDVIFYGPGATHDALWNWDGSAQGRRRRISIGGNFVPVPGDFDGDSFTDVLWYTPGRSSHPVWFFDRRAGHASVTVAIAGGYDDLVVTDLDGDGGDDLILWRWNATSQTGWLFGGRRTHALKALPNPLHSYPIPVDVSPSTPAADILWYRPAESEQRVALAISGHRRWTIANISGRYLVTGNFDGDNLGLTDLMVWESRSGFMLRGVPRGFDYAARARPIWDDIGPDFFIVGRFHPLGSGDSHDVILYGLDAKPDLALIGRDVDYPNDATSRSAVRFADPTPHPGGRAAPVASATTWSCGDPWFARVAPCARP